MPYAADSSLNEKRNRSSASDLNKAKYFGLMDCIECGSCAFVCPAHIKLVQRFRLGKAKIREEAALQKAKAANGGK